MSEGIVAPLARWNVGSNVYSVAISRDGTRVASGSLDRYVSVWDVRTGALVFKLPEEHSDSIESVAFSPDDARIVSGSWDHTIRMWDALAGTSIGEPLRGHTGAVWSVAFSHDSTRIVSGSVDCTIRIWDARTGVPIGEPLEGHNEIVWSVAFSNDGSRIISGSDDHTIRIWDARTGALVGEPLRGHTSPVVSVAISPDSTCVASGSQWYDNSIRVWDARTGTLRGEPLKGHTSTIYSLAFSSDGTRIVSGSVDKTIRIWDVHTGAPIGEPLKGHTGFVYSVVFSPDSSHIFSGSSDGTIAVWKAPQSTTSHNELDPHDHPSFNMVTRKMSVQEMFDCLVRHGCADLSPFMNPDRYSSSAIARGGFGDVWRGEMINGTLVAIKCVWLDIHLKGNKKGKKRAMREIYMWSKARHDNVQELTGIIMFHDALGMVSPWMEHGNLQDYLEVHPDVERYQLCIQLATGVSYLHDIGMVHGDLKAVNVLVSPDGLLRINDFDHAILASATLRFSTTSKPGGGTLRWMAPELLEQDDDETGSPKPTLMRNRATDIYALGMTMLETITGRVPYSEYRNDMAILRAIDKMQFPKRPKELLDTSVRSNDIWALLMACWDHDPAARPEAWHVLSTLQALMV